MPGFGALRNLSATVAEAFFPRRCAGCNAAGSLLCAACARTLAPMPEPQCPACGLPLRQPGKPCHHCADFPLTINGLRSVYLYEAPLREALLRLKYVGAKVAAEDLAPLLSGYLASHPLPVDCVTAVPLHPRRQRERGFNQAEALAAVLARSTGLELLTGVVVRTEDTLPQARQPSRYHRWTNVQSAFSVPGGKDLRGRGVLVIDDVCTTGATVDACGRALLAGGAAGVWGLTLARPL